MGTPLKIALLAVFAAAQFLMAQKAVITPLAHFVFFPVSFLAIYFFFDRRDWFFYAAALVLAAGSHVYSLGTRFPQETLGLAGISIGGFFSLLYFRRNLDSLLQVEEKSCGQVQAELTDLRGKHATRVDSLLHLEKQVASLINLFEIARDFNECLDFKETAQILYKKVLPELSFERSELIVLAREKSPPEMVKVYAISRNGVEEKTKLSQASEESEWVRRASEQKGFVSTDGTWLFPLILEGEFNGLFSVEGAEKQDLAKFEVLASQLTLQVRRVGLYEMVHELSIVDGLTGVFVRRHFLERFEEEIRRAMKYGFPLSVLMLDIDHFKRYNDDFGHLVGDTTLKEVARLVRANVRNVDIVARYGGEEFAVVIPETKEEGALEVSERIRSAVARHPFRVYDEETRVTVSLGISVYPQDIGTGVSPAKSEYDERHLFDLLQKADRALYRAKEEGRNRIVTYRSLALQ